MVAVARGSTVWLPKSQLMPLMPPDRQGHRARAEVGPDAFADGGMDFYISMWLWEKTPELRRCE